MTEHGPALIVGGDGVVGRALAERLRRDGRRVIATTRRAQAAAEDRPYLDLADDPSDWRPPAGVSCVYLLAAVTSQEACRRDPAGTRRINVDAAVTIARTCAATGAFVAFPSTNLVFDGTRPLRRPHEPTSPQSEYARQKAAAESGILALGTSVAVVRVPKVLDPGNRLICGWMEALAAGWPIEPFYDLVIATVPLSLFVEALVRIGEGRRPGLWQVSGHEDVTYADIARAIARGMGADEGLVRPISATVAGLEVRPTHATLDSTASERELGIVVPPLQDQVAEVFLAGCTGCA